MTQTLRRFKPGEIPLDVTRAELMLFAREQIQEALKEVDEKDREGFVKGFVTGLNASLKGRGFPETDCAHILPSFSSDSSLITYRMVFNG